MPCSAVQPPSSKTTLEQWVYWFGRRALRPSSDRHHRPKGHGTLEQDPANDERRYYPLASQIEQSCTTRRMLYRMQRLLNRHCMGFTTGPRHPMLRSPIVNSLPSRASYIFRSSSLDRRSPTSTPGRCACSCIHARQLRSGVGGYSHGPEPPHSKPPKGPQPLRAGLCSSPVDDSRR